MVSQSFDSCTSVNYHAAVSCIALAAGVACGAFGAHALKEVVSPSDLVIWEKAVMYHLIHAVGALVVSNLFASQRVDTKRIATLMLCSIVVFSGTLYALVLSNLRWLGMITPIGGVGFIISWLLLARFFVVDANHQRSYSLHENE